MVKIQENVDIRDYTTFKIGGRFRFFAVISSIGDLSLLYTIVQNDERYKSIPVFILGGGSNIIFSDGVIEVLAIKIEIKGFEIRKDANTYTYLKVGAGEVWDNVVARSIEMGLSGLELLSAIPGTAGATPVQNVGAYGTEVKDTILEVEVYDIKNNKIKIFTNSECKFKYRDSIFKNEAKNLYIITAVTYKLNKFMGNMPDYLGIKKYFMENNIKNPSLRNIRDAIIKIRSMKLPNPKEIPNVGSFFKNPIIKKQVGLKLIEKYPDLKMFPIDDELVKIPAGWLIENSGLKGESFGNVSVYDKNALVLINNGQATMDDLMKAKNIITEMVFSRFGIKIEQEPEML